MSQSSEILARVEKHRLYRSFYDKSPTQTLNKHHIPEALWPLLHYAEFWGISDDICCERLVTEASSEILANLKNVIGDWDDVLDDWLCGDEAVSPTPTNEYVAYSAMRMSADFA